MINDIRDIVGFWLFELSLHVSSGKGVRDIALIMRGEYDPR